MRTFNQNQLDVNERCSVCRQFKPISKRLAGATITGSMRHRPAVLVCGDCDDANSEEYRQSQRRFVSEQIALIDQLAIAHPGTAQNFQQIRDGYVRTLQGLGGAL